MLAVYTCANPALASPYTCVLQPLPSVKLLDYDHPNAPSTHHSDKFLMCFVCYSCFISCYPFDCPVHPDALHPPSPPPPANVVNPAPVLLLPHLLLPLCYSGCRQMAGCRPARREPANLPAGIAAKQAAAAAPAGKGSMAGLPSRLLWSRQPRPGKRPVSPRRRPALHTNTRQNNQRVTAYKTRKDGRCSTQCVGDSPVERRGGAGYVGLFCAGSGGR